MWKVLGKEVLYIDIGPVWVERILDLSVEHDNRERFVDLMNKTEVSHMFNGSTEIHSIILRLPENCSPDDIQFMADVILKIAQDNVNEPFISLDNDYQKCQVVIDNTVEPELIGLNRTEGFSSGKIFMPILDSLTKPGRPNESIM